LISDRKKDEIAHRMPFFRILLEFAGLFKRFNTQSRIARLSLAIRRALALRCLPLDRFSMCLIEGGYSDDPRLKGPPDLTFAQVRFTATDVFIG
jgi:hypothetical protein